MLSIVGHGNLLKVHHFSGPRFPVYGVSSQYALIWIEPGAPGLGWTDAFPVGLSCGGCVPAGPGGGFDSFEPISCDELSIVVPSEL